jgi:HEPN domain-containing protein
MTDPTSGDPDGLFARLHGEIDAIERLRDEIRVRIHLAQMDARDVWERAETRLADLRKKAKDRIETAETLLEIARELAGTYRNVRRKIEDG